MNGADQTVFSSLLKSNGYCEDRFGGGSLGIKQEIVCVQRIEVLDEIAPAIELKNQDGHTRLRHRSF
jgi:hypothetical protein